MKTRTLLALVFTLIVLGVAARSALYFVSFNRALADFSKLSQDVEEAESTIFETASLAVDLETGLRGWLITGDERFKEPYSRQVGRRAAIIERLIKLEENDPTPYGTAVAARLGSKLDDWNTNVAERLFKDPAVRADPQRYLAMNIEGKRAMDSIRSDLAILRSSLSRRRESDARTLAAFRDRQVAESWVTGAIFVLLLGILAAILMRGIETPLAMLATHINRSRGHEAAPQIPGGVREVRVLAQALNDMNARIAATRARDKRFTELVTALSQGASVQKVAEIGLRAVLAEQGAAAGVLWISRADKSPLQALATVALDRAVLIPGSSPLANEVFATGRAAVLDNLPSTSSHVLRSALVEAIPRALLALPIGAGAELIGAVELAGEIGQLREGLDLFLSRIGLALQKARADEATAALQDRVSMLNEELQSQNEELQAQEEELRVQSQELLSGKADLAERNEALMSASNLKTDFVASMSHELRTPLNAVMGFSDLLLSSSYGPLTAEQTEAVSDVLAAGGQLLNLVNDILDLSKIEAGRLDLSIVDVDLFEIVEQAVSMIRPAAKHKRIVINQTIAQGQHSCATDPNRCRQVLTNLLSNAVKFTPEGGSVTVTAVPVNAGLRVEVKDTGIGINAADQARLFQPFTQLGAGGTGGTGLGLSISKRLVGLMGGSLGVDSMPGKGSTFFFTVPTAGGRLARSNGNANGLKHAALGSPDMPLAVHTRASSEPRTPPSAHILIVEDQRTDARVTEGVLVRQGYQVRVAPTAEKAIEELEREMPAVIIIDLGLPGMSGFALIERLRNSSRWGALPVIVLTGRDLTLEEERQLKARVALVAVKGVMTGAGFLDVVADLVCGRRDGDRAVLIIDDSEVNRKVLSNMLAPRGFHLREAESARVGIDIALQTRHDVILMDIRMPGMDGLEATRILRRDPRTAAVPIIAVSAQAMPGDAQRAIEAGCTAYISKPVARQELLRTIDKVIQDTRAPLPGSPELDG